MSATDTVTAVGIVIAVLAVAGHHASGVVSDAAQKVKDTVDNTTSDLASTFTAQKPRGTPVLPPGKIVELMVQNRNFLTEMVWWHCNVGNLRIQRGQLRNWADAWQSFRSYLTGKGQPDPGDVAPEEWYAFSQNQCV